MVSLLSALIRFSTNSWVSSDSRCLRTLVMSLLCYSFDWYHQFIIIVIITINIIIIIIIIFIISFIIMIMQAHFSNSSTNHTDLVLALVIAYCLLAPSHYVKQSWLNISEFLWHSPEPNFTTSAPNTILYNELEIYTIKITSTSCMDQWNNIKG